MNKMLKTVLVISSLALAGAFAQQTPSPQPAPAQPMQRMMFGGPGVGTDGNLAHARIRFMQRMMFGGPGVGNLYFAAAQFLGVTPAELFLLSGGTKTLVQIATDLGKTPAALEAALVTARNQGIDRAVQVQRLTTEQANTFKASSQAVARAFMAQPVQQRFDRDGRGWPKGRGR